MSKLVLQEGDWKVINSPPPVRRWRALYAVEHNCLVSPRERTKQATYFMDRCKVCKEAIPQNMLALRDFANL